MLIVLGIFLDILAQYSQLLFSPYVLRHVEMDLSREVLKLVMMVVREDAYLIAQVQKSSMIALEEVRHHHQYASILLTTHSLIIL